MTVREAIEDIFNMKSQDYVNREMDLTFITYEILDNIPQFKNDGWTTETLRPKVTQAIQGFLPKTINGKQDLKSNSLLVRVKNGKGGFKSGVYKLRRRKKDANKPVIAPLSVPSMEVTNHSYVDAAGRMAVCSELLFRGYDVSVLTVNDFADVVAIRKAKSFIIKTCSILMRSNSLSVRINEKTIKVADFVVAVIRASKRKQTINQYFIIPVEDIKRWNIGRKTTIVGNELTITFEQKNNHIYLKGEVVDEMLNKFSAIK